MSFESQYERLLLRQQIILKERMIVAVRDAIDDLATYLARYAKKFPDDFRTRITFIHRSGIQAQLRMQLAQLTNDLTYLTNQGIKDAWDLSNYKSNILIKEYITGMSVPVGLASAMFGNNERALISYLENRSMISDRVLSYTGLYQEQIEKYMASGIIQGKSAREIAMTMLRIANDPMSAFKSLTKEFPGVELTLGDPGRGVYHSIYANLFRIARTETNIAYRLANYEKRQNVPYVVGMRIHLSDNHDIFDICDCMEGSYPVEFVFCGWHPNCVCYETDILAERDEFQEWMRNGMPDGGLNSRKTVDRIPLSAERYILSNQAKFENAYFYRDNFVGGKPMDIIGGPRKDLKPYDTWQRSGDTRQIERIIKNSTTRK